jgi:hypothetical protein
LLPQLAAPASVHCSRGSIPAGTVEQVPAVPVSAQDLHRSVQAVWQQTPWAQKPERQSSPKVQVEPAGFFPQLMLLQTLPIEHSADVVQVDPHIPAGPHA